MPSRQQSAVSGQPETQRSHRGGRRERLRAKSRRDLRRKKSCGNRSRTRAPRAGCLPSWRGCWRRWREECPEEGTETLATETRRYGEQKVLIDLRVFVSPWLVSSVSSSVMLKTEGHPYV